jgi:hypothetical protein
VSMTRDSFPGFSKHKQTQGDGSFVSSNNGDGFLCRK